MNELNQADIKKEKFLLPGFVLDNRFEIKEPIRKTSGCVVYRAFDREAKSDKAVLVISTLITTDYEAMDNLRESVKSLKWINHPYIARFYGLHTQGELSYLEMEDIVGKSIKRKKYESPNQKFSENMAKWVALQILEGLAYAHRQNLLHRNLKPQKIIFTSNGQIRLIDFGVSDALRNAMALVRDVTSRSSILFMPPEQIRGKHLSVQSDIYSLGATLYYLLDGKPPFHHGDIYYQILNEKPAPIESVSKEFNYILQICLAKDSKDRYNNCDQMIAEIKRISSRHEEKEKTKPISKIEPERAVAEKIIFPVKTEQKELVETDNIFSSHLLEKIKANKTILFWIGLLLVIVTTSIFVNKLFRSDIEKSDSSHRIAGRPNANTPADFRMIETLKIEAEAHLKNDRLILPEGNNAYELYQEILKIDPKNDTALNQIEQIKSKVYKSIRSDIAAGFMLEAEHLLNSSMEFFSEDKAFQNLEKEFKEQLQRLDTLPLNIEILNGAGIGGIAGILNTYLRNKNYKIVLSANYRTNGTVNWQVQRSFFIGSIPKNKRIEQLEKLLNIKYERKKLNGRQSSLGNVLIVLGKDYKRIPAFN